MSSQRRRGRGKRPREERSHGSTSQSFPSSSQQSQYTSSYDNSTYGHSQFQSPVPSPISPAFSQPQLQPATLNQAPPGKVAIPALKPPGSGDTSQGSKKSRTSHACDYCRKAKAGCTGGQPCVRCKHANISCVYGDGKRDREKKKLSQLSEEASSLSQHNSEILDAVRRIRLDSTLSLDGIRTALDDVLSMTPIYVSPKTISEVPFSPSQFSPRAEEPSVENEDVSDVGSTGSLDIVHVDTDRDETRATGHLGKSSAVAWAKRTAEECDTKTHEPTFGTQETGYALASYHTEDADVEYVDLSNVGAFNWPDFEMANGLLALYFDNVHNVLPIVDRQSFMTKYNQFHRGKTDLSTDESVWLGTLNIIFAISAVYGQLTRRYYRGHHHDHLVFLKRARMLCLDQDLLFQDARVSMTRVLGLLCLYFMATCRLNRAWTICGLAIRQALTLGLQIRSHAEGLSEYEKEERLRLWWSLYTLECQLDELTGRPSCIADQDISVPLPMNINEGDVHPGELLPPISPLSEHFRTRRGSRDSDNRPTATYQMPTGITKSAVYKFPTLTPPTTTSTFFIYRIQLCIVSHEIVTQLYCAATTKAKWSEIQDTIRRIDHRLLSWCDTLPPEFNITFDKWTEPDWTNPHTQERLGLAMMFNSSRMILYRPCLCRFERRIKSHDFNQEGAEKCIHSARTMISLLHWSASSVNKLYSITPFWSTLHFLCEALSVLMLEMAFQAQHLPDEAAYILDDAKNGVLWLRSMAGESVSARKAWEIFDALARLVAPMISWSVYDLPTEAPVPGGYNWRRFNVAAGAGGQQTREEISQEQVRFGGPTVGWNQEQNFGFNTDAGAGGYGFQTGTGEEQLRNPLDHTTAVQMFGSIGRVHGVYDEPWQHIFSSGLAGGQGQAMQEMQGMESMQGYGGFGSQVEGLGQSYQGGI